jgi:hypothetical protein
VYTCCYVLAYHWWTVRHSCMHVSKRVWLITEWEGKIQHASRTEWSSETMKLSYHAGMGLSISKEICLLIQISYLFSFLAVLRFKLRAFHLLGRCPTIWTTLPALFALVYFSDRDLCFCPGAASDFTSISLSPLESQTCATTPSLFSEMGGSH